MNCQFCYTGRIGLLGNLSAAQIVEQVRACSQAQLAGSCYLLPAFAAAAGALQRAPPSPLPPPPPPLARSWWWTAA
jgi:hypothetical protein